MTTRHVRSWLLCSIFSLMTATLTPLDLRGTTGDLRSLLPAPDLGDDGPFEVVRAIVEDVRHHGDEALLRYTEELDHARPARVAVSPEEVAASPEAIPTDLLKSLQVAAEAIEAYHRTQEHPPGTHRHNGVVVRDRRVPVDRAGLYVPGGRAAYPSTVLMTAIPARVAGVGELALCVPPGPDGHVPAVTLAAAAVAGVDEVYGVGGAQAIAALAYGTESVRPVDVIAGPGNVYVAMAQRLVAGQGAVGVPSAFAGPSEVVVVADDTTCTDYAAIDLLVQAEHGPLGLAWLVTWSEAAAQRIIERVGELVATAPRRDEIAATLARGGFAVITDGVEQALEVVNVVAPEHLELMNENPEALLGGVRSAGAIFLGPWAPASVGDYLAGPNHVLPTARTARFGSALRVDDFCKHQHIVSLDRDALTGLAPHVARLAEAEGLMSHAESVRLRAGASGPEASR